MKKKALITGVAGQDGPYLAEFLLGKGYEVHGVVYGGKTDAVPEGVETHRGDVTSRSTMWNLIADVQPDEVYHLAGFIKIGETLKDPFTTFQVNLDGTHNLLYALRMLKPDCKFFFASTSEVFGVPESSPQSERTPFNSVTPYGISKMAATQLVRMYREIYKMFACAAILFNHISPRIDEDFLPRKITSSAARIKYGLQKELRLGNLDAKRDWGYAKDYVEAMWLMLQGDAPRDYVVGTGKPHSVRELVELVFGYLGLDWKQYVVHDEQFARPADIPETRADISKIRSERGWEPKTSFEELIRMMVDADMEKFKPV